MSISLESLSPLMIWLLSVARWKRSISMNNYLKKKRRSRYMTGEDIDMFREREQEQKRSKNNDESICDTHIDGA